MLNEERANMVIAPHVAVFPILAIFMSMLAFNLWGDGDCGMRWLRNCVGKKGSIERRGNTMTG